MRDRPGSECVNLGTWAVGLLVGLLLVASPIFGSAVADQSVIVTWDRNPEPDVISYNVYYKDADEGQTSIVSTSGISARVDGLLQGHTYAFWVTAVNSSNLESDPSDVVTYTVGGPVTGQNGAPVLQPIPDQIVPQGLTLQLALSATNQDVPSRPLTYSLIAGPPGTSVDPVTGLLLIPTLSLSAPSTNLVTVSAADEVEPVLTDSTSFQVVVLKPVRDQTLALSTGQSVDISWSVGTGGTNSVYFTERIGGFGRIGTGTVVLQASDDLRSWTTLHVFDLRSPTVVSIQDNQTGQTSSRFYRLLQEAPKQGGSAPYPETK